MFDHYDANGLPTSCDRAESELKQLRAEHNRYRQHSITLNTIGYAMAEALGEAKDGRADGNPEDQVRRLIAELEAYRRDDRHIIDLRPDFSWVIQHPMACRPNLFDCPVNKAALDVDAFPDWAPGRYYCALVDGELQIGEAVSTDG